MLELARSPDHLPLYLASRLLHAPGTWAPGSRLPLGEMGALVTPPLGREWDGDAAPWESRPGAFLWAPPRRPLARFLRHLAREWPDLPRLFTLAPDAPPQIEAALHELEGEATAAVLLWEATPPIVAAARRAAPGLPLLVELPCTEAREKAPALVEAGADGIWLGAPQGGGGQRLWGPALFPTMLATLEASRAALPVLLIVGATIGSAEDAQRLLAAGADALALDPAWWVAPALAEQVASVVRETAN